MLFSLSPVGRDKISKCHRAPLWTMLNGTTKLQTSTNITQIEHRPSAAEKAEQPWDYQKSLRSLRVAGKLRGIRTGAPPHWQTVAIFNKQPRKRKKKEKKKTMKPENLEGKPYGHGKNIQNLKPRALLEEENQRAFEETHMDVERTYKKKT